MILLRPIAVVLTLCLVVSVVDSASPRSSQPRKLMPGDKLGEHFYGTVKQITDFSITIYCGGERASDPAQAITGEYVFVLSEVLASGKSLDDGIPSFAYRISDLKVGDRISMDYDFLGGQSICTAICIERRPGGRVPPCPSKHDDKDNAWHDQANAYQDLEEKGIPLPFKYDSVALQKAHQKYLADEEKRNRNKNIPPPLPSKK